MTDRPAASPHASAPAAPAPAAAAVFPGDSEMAARCRAFDWGATPLGPVAQWSASLRTAAGLVVAAPVGMILLWGPDLVQVYNDAYAAVMGAKHPGGLGQPNRACWPEVWDFTGPIYEAVRGRGETRTFTDQRLVLERGGAGGVPEEAFFTLAYSPVHDGGGGAPAAGILVTVVETTAQVRGREAEAERTRLAATLAGERTRLLEDVFRQAPSFLHVLGGPDFVFEFANDAYYRLVGRRDLLGRPAFEAMPEAAAGGFPDRLARVLATGEPFAGRELPVTLARTPGAPPEERLIDLEYLPLADADGRVTRVLGYGTDVTDHVRARRAGEAALDAERAELERTNQLLQEQAAELEAQAEELQATAAHAEEQAEAAERARRAADAERARAEAILDGMADAYFALDADFRVVAANAAMVRGSGLARDRLLGGVFWELFPGAAGTPFERHYRAAATQGVEAHFTHRYADARLDLVAEVDAYPGPAGADGRRGVVVFWRDVTARARAEAERERLLGEAEAARATAEAANRAKSDFLAVMSHELRTPLNAIGGYAQLMELGLQGPVTPEQVAALGRIQRGQQHLLGLINSVLNYAKLEAGQVRYEVADVPAAELLAEVAALVAPQARAKGLTLAVEGGAPDTPDGRPLVVRADPEKSRQALLNLLSNAVKFTRGGGRVAVSCTRAGDGRAAFTVADTGRGIAADQLERVFQPFVQVDASLTRTTEGTGLGLAISRDLARGMGGDLTVESTPGVGSTFTLTLPTAAGERRPAG